MPGVVGQKKVTVSTNPDYAVTWETWTLIPAGAGWCFAVGIITTDNGTRRRVRVAKGKVKAAAKGELPIAQQAKFNLKPADWEQLRAAIDAYVEQLAGEEKESADDGDTETE